MLVIKLVGRAVFGLVFGVLFGGAVLLLALETTLRRKMAERAGGTIEW